MMSLWSTLVCRPSKNGVTLRLFVSNPLPPSPSLPLSLWHSDGERNNRNQGFIVIESRQHHPHKGSYGRTYMDPIYQTLTSLGRVHVCAPKPAHLNPL